MARKPKSLQNDEYPFPTSKGTDKPDKAVDVEAQRTRLKTLIALGKDRGFLTYAEINDHLPDMVDAEQIESIITTFNDMGIQVYDVAPDAETLLLTEAAPTVTDDDAEEEAAQALSVVRPNSESTVVSAAVASSSASSSSDETGAASVISNVSASGASS